MNSLISILNSLSASADAKSWWVAFFSDDCSSLIEYCRNANKWPDLALTDNIDFENILPEVTQNTIIGSIENPNIMSIILKPTDVISAHKYNHNLDHLANKKLC